MRELDQIMKSVQHASDKIDEYEETIAATGEKIKVMERKQTALRNQCTHLETKVAALEQRLEVKDQAVLGESIEIAGIPVQDKENVLEIVKKVGELLQITSDDGTQVRGARRLPARNGKTGAIMVQLNSEGCKSQWVAAGRAASLVVSNVLPSSSGNAATEAIYVREALTPRTKYLLSKAKRELKDAKSFKFVWCKYGKVFARKSDSSKITWIRSDADIESLTA
ncbi:uncharacterized protein LOC126381403 [Pectinophora gossypiella]|uniref:uncharacterized protein LOC126381403 n=1 Tax=Pectinophora gossypiella TaxID=13191 RepID=UPI00214EAB41|nr:uncharacterized protein LOC126381403 [Pectinophora gossypiella]